MLIFDKELKALSAAGTCSATPQPFTGRPHLPGPGQATPRMFLGIHSGQIFYAVLLESWHEGQGCSQR